MFRLFMEVLRTRVCQWYLLRVGDVSLSAYNGRGLDYSGIVHVYDRVRLSWLIAVEFEFNSSGNVAYATLWNGRLSP